MELRRYWQIILKRRGTLLRTIGLIVGIVILGSFIISPVYQFSCNVWVKIEDPKTTLTGVPDSLAGLGIVSNELVMYSQLSLIRNLSMVRDVIKKMRLEKKKGDLLSATDFLEPSSLGLLFRKTGVRMGLVASTQIIQVSGFSSSPQEAAAIANQVADSFVAMYNQNIKDTANQALSFIQASIPKVSAQLKEAENALAEYKVANHISNVSYLREKLLTNLATLKETKDTNETEIAGIEKTITQIQAKLKKIPEFQKTTLEYRANATLEYIRQKLMDAESNIASNSVRTTPQYYGQKQLQASIERLKDEYRKQARKLLYSETAGRNSLYTNLIQTLVENEINLAARNGRRQLMSQLIQEKQKELDELTMKELQALSLERQVTALQNGLSNLLAKEQVSKLAAHLDLSNATVIERAVVPSHTAQIKKFRWFPKRKLLTMFSFLFALLLGMTTILVQEYLDDTFSDPKEAEEYLQFPMLARLPELPPSETADLHRIMAYVPWTQAIWALPDLLKPAGEESPAGVWSITSSGTGAGKSLVAASLGWVLALRKLKVLLVDLNFFHPSLSSLWHLPPGAGVREIVQGTATLEECLRQVGSGELYLLPNGKAHEVTWAELDPKSLAQWLTTVRTRFDVLVLDTPAVGVGEGAPLAALGEQTLVVVRADHSPRTQVARALDQIQRCHGRIAGLVFNRYRTLAVWPLLSPTLSAMASWPPVQRLVNYVEKTVKLNRTAKP